MATAAWLTLLGPPSRCTVHHIPTCNSSLNESQLTFCLAESIQSQFHLFLPKLISQGRLLLPLSPLPQGHSLPENLQQGPCKVNCPILQSQSETETPFNIDVCWPGYHPCKLLLFNCPTGIGISCSGTLHLVLANCFDGHKIPGHERYAKRRPASDFPLATKESLLVQPGGNVHHPSCCLIKSISLCEGQKSDPSYKGLLVDVDYN